MFAPIYTEPAECQDCYKCVRECSVKSILVDEAHKASIVPHACVYCGHCVDVCPVKAKKIRSDVFKIKSWIAEGKKVFALLAPSILSEFPSSRYDQIVNVLTQLGFHGAQEISFAAYQVSYSVSQILLGDLHKNKVYISTACPSVVYMVQKYYPSLVDNLISCPSPALLAAKILKNNFDLGSNELSDPDLKIVFIGPCVAKMREADLNPSYLDAAISFIDLKEWASRSEVSFFPPPSIVLNHASLPHPLSAQISARIYPVDGGMNEVIKKIGITKDINLFSFSGLKRVRAILDELENQNTFNKTTFLELLACAGGCINGPLSNKQNHLVSKICKQKDEAEISSEEISKCFSNINSSRSIRSSELSVEESSRNINYDNKNSSNELSSEDMIPLEKKYSEIEITQILHKIGKEKPEDQLNCNGCGHETCRNFAVAMLNKLAIPSMCVSYMRRLATNKANALIKAMPSAVVIVDSELKVIESNQRFIDMLDDDSKYVSQVIHYLSGVYLEKLVPFSRFFQMVLQNNQEIIEKNIEYNNKFFTISIFPIEKGQVVGGVIQDITRPFVQREQIVKKAHEVIIKNLTTVQKIAYLLGENAAESEILLNSIIKSFSTSTENNDKK